MWKWACKSWLLSLAILLSYQDHENDISGPNSAATRKLLDLTVNNMSVPTWFCITTGLNCPSPPSSLPPPRFPPPPPPFYYPPPSQVPQLPPAVSPPLSPVPQLPPPVSPPPPPVAQLPPAPGSSLFPPCNSTLGASCATDDDCCYRQTRCFTVYGDNNTLIQGRCCIMPNQPCDESTAQHCCAVENLEGHLMRGLCNRDKKCGY